MKLTNKYALKRKHLGCSWDKHGKKANGIGLAGIRIGHRIAHRFSLVKTPTRRCQVCDKRFGKVGFGVHLECDDCGYVCHAGRCAGVAEQTCGMSPVMLAETKKY